MAKPTTNTLPYFTHDSNARSRKTLNFLHNEYGNDGYACWWILLEVLCETENHFLNLNKHADYEYIRKQFFPKQEKDTGLMTEIFEDMVMLGAIDKKMYQKGIIWCQNLIDRADGVYGKRVNDAPTRELVLELCAPEDQDQEESITSEPESSDIQDHSESERSGKELDESERSDPEHPDASRQQSKVKESKVKKVKETKVKKKKSKGNQVNERKVNPSPEEFALQKEFEEKVILNKIRGSITDEHREKLQESIRKPFLSKAPSGVFEQPEIEEKAINALIDKSLVRKPCSVSIEDFLKTMIQSFYWLIKKSENEEWSGVLFLPSELAKNKTFDHVKMIRGSISTLSNMQKPKEESNENK